MKILRISTLFFSLALTACATPYAHAQDFIVKALETAQKQQTPLVITAACAVTAGYLVHAMYLDGMINDHNSLWHWSMHHIKDGIIDPDALVELAENRYPELKTLHPLTAFFATAHAAQIEIDRCLTLRGVLKNLANVRLEWIMSETIATLDKKLECLYILKIMLANCTLETRKKFKKKAQLC